MSTIGAQSHLKFSMIGGDSKFVSHAHTHNTHLETKKMTHQMRVRIRKKKVRNFFRRRQSASEKALRRVVVRSEIRTKCRELEPSSRHHRKPKTVREPKRIEANNNMSSTDRTADEKNFDTVEALKCQVQDLKRKL